VLKVRSVAVVYTSSEGLVATESIWGMAEVRVKRRVVVRIYIVVRVGKVYMKCDD
jgi:hypothetical protein